MKQMMEEVGKSHQLTILSYPGAGHLIEPPYTPHCQASNFIIADTRTKGYILRLSLMFNKAVLRKYLFPEHSLIRIAFS